MKPRLVRVSGKAPEGVLLNSTELKIGRDSSNDLRLEDPTVSSRHCLIQRDAETSPSWRIHFSGVAGLQPVEVWRAAPRWPLRVKTTIRFLPSLTFVLSEALIDGNGSYFATVGSIN
jgi:FHA domain-containing protein